METLTLKDLDLKNKKVLVRVDFNVPLDDRGNVTDDTRIVASLETIKYLLSQGAAVILMSHLGRPKGTVNHKFSLAPAGKRLGEMLGIPIKMAPDAVGPVVKKMVDALKPKEILLLENLRFHRAEEHPEENPEFAKELSSFADLYVDDAFGSAHRAHASIVEVAKFFPEKAAAGFLLEKEIRFLGDTLKYPKRPFYTLIGGAKISSKIGVLKALLGKIDGLLIGGAMAFTFFKAQGIEIGKSLYEPDFVDEARKILDAYLQAGKVFLLPLDCVVVKEIKSGAPSRTLSIKQGFAPDDQGVDIGPLTIERYKKELSKAKTILWNGPMGVFEIPEFAKGTNEIAESLAEMDATTIVGGGDSVAAVQKAHLAHAFSHLSTGGGASLEYLEQGTLPGIDALTHL